MSNSTNTYTCKFCSKSFKTAHALHCHEWRCPSNPERKLPPVSDKARKIHSETRQRQIAESLTKYCKFCHCKGFKDVVQHELHCAYNPNKLVYKKITDHSNDNLKPKFPRSNNERYVKLKEEKDKAYYVHRIRSNNGDLLDVSKFEIDVYRENHPRCEVCDRDANELLKTSSGKLVQKRLCIDHDHDTKKFRGLLCMSCNIELGWVQLFRQQISEYLSKDTSDLTSKYRQQYKEVFGKDLIYDDGFEERNGVDFECKYCHTLFANNRALRTHERRCLFNPTRVVLQKGTAVEHTKSYYTSKAMSDNGDLLNVSHYEIDCYIHDHPTCEICGKEPVEVARKSDGTVEHRRLCVDHDHTTKKFRGVLCSRCNRQLGWYENHLHDANAYLDKDMVDLTEEAKHRYRTLFGIPLEYKN